MKWLLSQQTFVQDMSENGHFSRSDNDCVWQKQMYMINVCSFQENFRLKLKTFGAVLRSVAFHPWPRTCVLSQLKAGWKLDQAN